MNIYAEMIAAKVPVANHASDLYVPVNAVTTGILLKFPVHFKNATRFRDNVASDLMYDIPFAFQPFWDAVAVAPRR